MRFKDRELSMLCLLRLEERTGTSHASWQKKGDNFFPFKDISVHLVELAVGMLEISHPFKKVAIFCCSNPYLKPHLGVLEHVLFKKKIINFIFLEWF